MSNSWLIWVIYAVIQISGVGSFTWNSTHKGEDFTKPSNTTQIPNTTLHFPHDWPRAETHTHTLTQSLRDSYIFNKAFGVKTILLSTSTLCPISSCHCSVRPAHTHTHISMCRLQMKRSSGPEAHQRVSMKAARRPDAHITTRRADRQTDATYGHQILRCENRHLLLSPKTQFSFVFCLFSLGGKGSRIWELRLFSSDAPGSRFWHGET